MRSLFVVFFATVLVLQPERASGQAPERVSSRSVASSRVNRRPKARTTPRYSHERNTAQRRASQSQYGAIGLGDYEDLTYTISLEIGGEPTVLNLDTGSSDLWVITSSCNASICQSMTTSQYSASSFQQMPTGASMKLVYGDSSTGSYASGVIGTDSVKLAGIGMNDQYFLAVNDTNNVCVKNGAAGVLGLGFPTESNIQYQAISTFGSKDSDSLLNSIPTTGPFIPRLVSNGLIGLPMFTITLQRETIGPASALGQFTLGTLPDGVDNSSLTWVPVRLYSASEGGLVGPTFDNNEIYPLRWEVPLDGVFLDGVQLPNSNESSPSTRTTALIDTGNSILRGPKDVVQSIYTAISPTFNASATNSVAPYDCSVPHTLSFQFGGKQFPIDPEDFMSPSLLSSTGAECDVAGNLVETDPPSIGTLFSWSLGDTFLKSNLVAFYYGNLTNPSVDPPRIGFMSLLSNNVSGEVKQDVETALVNGGFLATSEIAPTSTISLTSRPIAHPASQIPNPNIGNGDGSRINKSSPTFDFDKRLYLFFRWICSVGLSVGLIYSF